MIKFLIYILLVTGHIDIVLAEDQKIEITKDQELLENILEDTDEEQKPIAPTIAQPNFQKPSALWIWFTKFGVHALCTYVSIKEWLYKKYSALF